MNETQAKRLGKAIRTARLKKGLSQEQTMRATGLDLAWLSRLEAGRYANPDSGRLLKLIEILELDPARIEKLTGHALSAGLPGVRTYFRSKTPASQEDIDEIERHVKRILGKYDNVDLDSPATISSNKTRGAGA